MFDWHTAMLHHLERSIAPLLVVLGPTASGKTSFSIDAALFLKCHGYTMEIINADSRQLYRALDIGTAKITDEEMHGVPHHLLSVLDPREPVTVAWYQREALRVIDDVLRRGAIPMLVGGSMLYLSSVIDGLALVEQSDPAVRRRLEEEYDRDAGVTSWAMLAERDPESAANIPRENKVYVVRALEIIALTGKKKSEQRHRRASPYDLFIMGIDQPRDILARRIIERTRAMFDRGWIAEVQKLMDRGYDERVPAMQSHGYREIMQALRSDIVDVDQLIDVISDHAIAYAKRQRTWWRNDDRIHWLRIDD